MTTLNEQAVMQRYGMLPGGERATNYAKALMIIMGADGEIAPAEMSAFKKRLADFGLPAEQVKALEDFDYKSASLKETLSFKPGGRTATFLLLDGIEMSSADGVYADAEKAAVAKTAEIVGVPKDKLADLEKLAVLEKEARELRAKVFSK